MEDHQLTCFKQSLSEIRGHGPIPYSVVVCRFEHLVGAKEEGEQRGARIQFEQWLMAFSNKRPDRVQVIRPYNVSLGCSVLVPEI